jgi:hypothetical protein
MNKSTKIKISLLVLFFVLFNIFILPLLRENGQNIENQKKWSIVLKIENEEESTIMEPQRDFIEDEMIPMKIQFLE